MLYHHWYAYRQKKNLKVKIPSAFFHLENSLKYTVLLFAKRTFNKGAFFFKYNIGCSIAYTCLHTAWCQLHYYHHKKYIITKAFPCKLRGIEVLLWWLRSPIFSLLKWHRLPLHVLVISANPHVTLCPVVM